MTSQKRRDKSGKNQRKKSTSRKIQTRQERALENSNQRV